VPALGLRDQGRFTYRIGDREEVYEPGDAFYLPPGHVPLGNEPGSEDAVQPYAGTGDRGCDHAQPGGDAGESLTLTFDLARGMATFSRRRDADATAASASSYVTPTEFLHPTRPRLHARFGSSLRREGLLFPVLGSLTAGWRLGEAGDER
jgi:hypothetical protein